MKTQIVSDMHIDINSWSKSNLLIKGSAELLIIAGDIAHNNYYAYMEYLTLLKKNYNKIIVVPGNHEYYGDDLNNSLSFLKEENDIVIGNNVKYIYNNQIFFLSTLWSAMEITKKHLITNGLNDFHSIKNCSFESYSEKYKTSLTFLNTINEDCVVITHHAPHNKLISPMFKHSQLNSCFCSNTNIHNPKIKYWIHGHTHCFMEKKIKDTIYLRNPYGYIRMNEHFSYKTKYIEL